MISLKNKLIGIIYEGNIKNKPIRDIHKALYKATINEKRVNAVNLYKQSVKYVKKAKNINDDSQMLVFLLALSTGMKHIINETVREDNSNQVDKLIKKEIKQNRDNGKYFYLASSHNDCAEDHKPYQGKLYVDEKYKENADFIREKGIKTIQWVMGKPAWFITRPYCRHYFIALSTDEVLNKSLKRLKKKYKTHSKEGNRDYQTPAKATLEQYKEQLKMLEEMYKIHRNQAIKNRILKLKMLIGKWESKID